ncbi:MAG TPA: hypothetical protein VK034_22065, partial [Enhygromyxa sp.]|nr:hypothetical protein [Enhygromyxa sp.]
FVGFGERSSASATIPTRTPPNEIVRDRSTGGGVAGEQWRFSCSRARLGAWLDRGLQAISVAE